MEKKLRFLSVDQLGSKVNQHLPVVFVDAAEQQTQTMDVPGRLSV
jgi:hypothetical protein